MKIKDIGYSIFQRVTSFTLIFAYITNILSVAFAWVLFGITFASAPALAGLNTPVQPVATCPPDFHQVGGTCLRTDKVPLPASCDDGFSLQDNVCKRHDDEEASGVCSAGWEYSTYKRRMCSQEYQSCSKHGPFHHKHCTTEYRIAQPQSLNCPHTSNDPYEDAKYSHYTPDVSIAHCSDALKAMGACKAPSAKPVTIDNSWHLNGYRCLRDIAMMPDKQCPKHYSRNKDTCEKVINAPLSYNCPVNTYLDNGQCFPGTRPACVNGSHLVNGICVNDTNLSDISCPAGQVMDRQSHLCIFPRNDSEPVTWTKEDFDYFYNEGMNLGKLTSSSIVPPDVTPAKDGKPQAMSVTPHFLDPTVKVTDPTVYSNMESRGVDYNNGFAAPAGTYQNEDQQTKYVRDNISLNNTGLKAVPTGDTAEKIIDNSNHTALAYGSVMDTRNINPPRKISMDSPMFANSVKSVSNAFNHKGAYFGDCSKEETTFERLDPTKIIKTSQSCFKPNKSNLNGCVRSREPIPPSIKIVKGLEDARVSVCGDKCIQLTLGRTDDNYLPQKGKCGVYTKEIVVQVKDGIHIDRATLSRTHYDDQFRLYADNNIIFDGVHMHFNTPDGFPTEATSCEQGVSRNTYDSRDVTPQFKTALTGDNEIKFTYKVGVGGEGEAYGVVDLLFDKPIKSTWGDKITDYPKGCTDALKDNTKFCTNNGWKCDKEYSSDDPNYGLVNVSKGDRGDGYGLPSVNGDALVLVARRDFDITGNQSKNCGMVVATTWKSADGNDDDGIYFCGNHAGIGTHTENDRQLRGTELSNILPTKGKWEVIAARVFSDRVIWYRYDTTQEKVVSFSSRILNGGPFDGLRMSGFRIARSQSRNSLDWYHKATDPLWLAYWQVLNGKNDTDLSQYLSKIALEQPWLQFKPLYPTDTGIPVCMEAHALDYMCDPLKGKSLNYGGAAFDFKAITNMADGCKQYDKNKECDALTKTCIPGWYDETSRTCYAWNENYSCEDHSHAMVTVKRKNNTCFTDKACIDGSCDVRADEKNADFTKALSQFAVVNEIGDKKNCTGTDPSTCRVFTGKVSMCSKDPLGMIDCCKAPEGVGQGDVFVMAGNMVTVESYMASESGLFSTTGLGESLQATHKFVAETAKGAWNTISKPIGDMVSKAWSSISTKFTGTAANSAGNTSLSMLGDAGTVIGDFASGLVDSLVGLKDQMLQWVFEQLPECLQNFIIGLADAVGSLVGDSAIDKGAENVGAEAFNSIGSNVMGVVSFIGWAYAAYQIANMAYQMIFACTEDEQKVGVDLIGKKCFWVYTKKPKKVLGVRMGKTKKFHCCYNNVLSRIIMEQASAQLGWTKRQYYDQGCNGLDFTQLGKVDFDKIDFSEWIDMMAQNNMIPDNKTQDDITKGNMMNGFGRMSTKERMDERGKGNVYVEHVKEMNKLDMGNKIDCSSYPRPAFCDTLNSYDRNEGL